MKLGIILGYSGRQISIPIDTIRHAESLGYDSVWTSEAYGSDAVTPAAWILAQTGRIKVGTAIMQMPARTPAMCAMTAMTLAQLSDNRFIVGLGASGPQVVEGWHGVAYGKPVVRLREYIEILRRIFARQEPLTYDGAQYQIPYRGPGASGLGKPLKSILAIEAAPKIYVASIAPAGVRAAAELGDGFFPIWMDPDNFSVFEQPINEGLQKAGKTRADFDVAPFVTVIVDDNVAAAMQPIREKMALYIGGMGARGRNFYNNYVRRLGFEEAAERIQELYLAGHKDEAMVAVPEQLIDACHLVGPRARIRARLQRWQLAGRRGEVDSMLIDTKQREALELVAEVMLQA